MKMFDTIASVANSYGEDSLEEIESFDSSVFLGPSYVYKAKNSDPSRPSKERRVLDYVHMRAPRDLDTLLPRVVDEVALSDGRKVTVQNRMPGAKVSKLSPTQAAAISRALAMLHALPAPGGVTEFEGAPEPSLSEYVMRSSERFVAKLSQSIVPSDLALVERAKLYINEHLDWFGDARLVVVHKDIFLENVLFDGEDLTAIIDWDAAQTAPAEWEHSILRQRFPDTYSYMRAAYDGELSDEGIDLCALLQALRFWKSFPEDQAFAAAQRQTIAGILDND